MAQAATAQPAKTLDECIRLVTAFQSFDDLKDTQPTYAPTFYRQGSTSVEIAAMRRVADAFNAWAIREGRPNRAVVRW